MNRYFRNEKTVSGRLHDETVMMNLDQGKYFSLNNVATRIWDLLAEPVTVDELCSVLTAEFDVDSRQCRSEVENYLEEMIRFGLVNFSPGGTVKDLG